MSDSFIFLPFRDGAPHSVPSQTVLRILETHRFSDFELIGGSNEIPTPLDDAGNSTIGDHVFVNCSNETVTELAIDRPLYDAAYRRLAFDFVCDLKLIMMSSGGGTLRTAPRMEKHLPNDMLAQFGDVDTNVLSPNQLP